MLKAIKEIIIMLLVCLIGILLFAVIFYEYIPNRKNVATVKNFTPSSAVQEVLSDNIDKADSDVIFTFQENGYEVTTSDLNSYKSSHQYVPGKSNPFGAVKDETKEEDQTTSTSENTTNKNSDVKQKNN